MYECSYTLTVHVFTFCQLKVRVCNVFYMWKWACINPLDWSDNYVRMKISKYRMVGNHGSSPLKSMSFSTVSVKMSESVWRWRARKCCPHLINRTCTWFCYVGQYVLSNQYNLKEHLMIVFASPQSQLTITTPPNCFSPTPNSWNTMNINTKP